MKEMLKNLVDEVINIDPENEILHDINYEKRLNLMKQDLNKTIDYLNTCSALEFSWATEVLDDLSEYFKSIKLIECVENNISRFDDEELIKDIKMTLDDVKMCL